MGTPDKRKQTSKSKTETYQILKEVDKSRCFTNVKKLPCRYRGQKKSWIYSTLFENLVGELDNQFENENRKVALIQITAQPIQILED